MTERIATYRGDIDGLRAVAVLGVVVNHISEPVLPGGYVGVDVFFVISGYLITRILRREVEERRFSFRNFYERRARRLFPALFAALAFTLIGSHLLLPPSDHLSTSRAALGTVLFSSNFVFWRDLAAGYFASDARLNPLLHMWSLAVEEQFYLLYPFLLIVTSRLHRRGAFIIVAFVATLSLVAASLLVQRHAVAVFFLSPFRAWELLAGALLTFGAIPPVGDRIGREVLGTLALAAIGGPMFFYDDHTVFPGLSAALPVIGTAMLIHLGAHGTAWPNRLLSSAPVVNVGLASYSIYLWHWPAIVLLRFATDMRPLSELALPLFGLTLALGSISYHLIEKPFRRAKASVGRVFMAAAAATVLLMVVSGIGILGAGLPGRFNSRVIAFDEARTPAIPFLQCADAAERFATDECMVGDPTATADILLWGDSHLLAWAPALDVALARLGRRAVLATHRACPPLIQILHVNNDACEIANRRVVTYLERTPELRTVLLAAHWNAYFVDGGPLRHQEAATPNDVAASSLIATVRWLNSRRRSAILLAPVPVHTSNVPLALALGARHEGGARGTSGSFDEHRENHRTFFAAAREVEGPGLTIVDPAKWMCAPDCRVELRGEALYRDEHHLSVAGAMAYEASLRSALQGILRAGR